MDKDKADLKFIFKIFSKHFKEFMGILLLSFALVAVSILVPLINQNMIDYGLVQRNYKYLIWSLIFLAGLDLLQSVFGYIQTVKEYKISIEIVKEMKVDALSHALKLQVRHIKKYGLYKILQDIEMAIEDISELFNARFLDIITDILKLGGCICALLLINWKITLMLFLLIPLKILFINRLQRKKEKCKEDFVKLNRELSVWYSDIFDGIYEIKLWNIYSVKNEQYKTILEKINSTSIRLLRLSALITLARSLIESFMFNLIYLIGALFLFNDEMTLGGIFSFIAYSGYILHPVDLLMNMKGALIEIRPCLKVYKDFWNLEEEESGVRKNIGYEINEIRFEKVSYGFDNHNVLDSVDLLISKGDRVAIIGDNGSGKTTLINLLLKFYKPKAGKIYINNIDSDEIDLAIYRNLFSVISQQAYLFNSTLKNNILMYGVNDHINNDYIRLKDTLLNFVNDRQNMNIGINGSLLSGGERQKIAMARGILKDARVMIMDEGTSNFDKKSEIKIFSELSNFSKDIFIAILHDYSYLKYFNIIIAVKDGKIIVQNVQKEN